MSVHAAVIVVSALLERLQAEAIIHGRRWFRKLQDGQSMVEYALIIALIAIVGLATIQALGGGVAQVFQRILIKLQGIG